MSESLDTDTKNGSEKNESDKHESDKHESVKHESDARSSASQPKAGHDGIWETIKESWSWMYLLLICIPIAAGLYWGHGSPVAQFIFSALAVMPLAGLMGDATEVIAEHAGPGIGGLLNATFGNAAELILGLFSVYNGLDDLVKASITGSIIGNALLVSGMSMFAGGIQEGGRLRIQKFNPGAIGTTATTAVMASVALTVPAVTKYAGSDSNAEHHLSVGVSVVLIISYITMLIFSLITHKEWFDESSGEEAEPKTESKDAIALEEPRKKSISNNATTPDRRTRSGTTSGTMTMLASMTKANLHEGEEEKGSLKYAIIKLLIASLLVAFMSEILVGAVEIAGEAIGVSQVFMGVIILAIVGNAAEHSTAIMMAMKNKMDVSLNIALGSSLQIAMFVGPVLCLCSYGREGEPLDLVFTVLEVFVVFLSLVVVWMIVQDGETTWMEGMLLMMLYIVIALGFAFLAVDEKGPE